MEMDAAKPSFQDQLTAAVAGDRDALLVLLLDCQSDLAAFVHAQVGQQISVHKNQDDILQETFIHAFRDVATLRAKDRAGFLGWLKVIAKNRIRDTAKYLSAAKRRGTQPVQRPSASEATSLVMELTDQAAGTASHFAAKQEAVDAMRLALAALPDDQRQAIHLHCFEGLTLEATAEKMGRSWDSVRGLIQRAKQSLKAALHRSSLWLSKG